MTVRGTRGAGFTLLELVIVIVLTSIIALVTVSFIRGPMEAYVDQSRRAGLVDTADLALRRMARDIRAALPNSVRVGGAGQYLEFIPVVDAGRYRSGPGAVDDDTDYLEFHGSGDSDFDLLGHFNALTGSTAGYRLVIYNDGSPGANAYAEANVVTPATTTISVSDEGANDHVHLNAPFRFAHQSPAGRVYLVSDPVSYECRNGELRIWRGYGWSASQPSSSGDFAGGSSALLAANVSCTFQYQGGTPSRSALATLRLSISRDGESVHLLHQVHVGNAP